MVGPAWKKWNSILPDNNSVRNSTGKWKKNGSLITKSFIDLLNSSKTLKEKELTQYEEIIKETMPKEDIIEPKLIGTKSQQVNPLRKKEKQSLCDVFLVD